MAEQYVDRVHTESAVLDIGGDVGALVLYTPEEFRGKEIEVSPKGDDARRTHTAVWGRQANGRVIFAALYHELPAGDYTIWWDATTPAGEVTVVGGAVTEVDWRHSVVAALAPYAGRGHSHGPGSQHLPLSEAPSAMLPPRYRGGTAVSAAPMGSASMRYDDTGQVAWDRMWTDFCDLALAGGPPHRDALLEPVTPDEARADPAAYERVAAEIERGLRLVTGLSTVRGKSPGWVGLCCGDGEMALWLLRAIVVENISVRREGPILFLPAGPAFRLDKEIKNVITAVAKTHHYWTEHLSARVDAR